nr:Abi family protein [uncultured Phocaeicola sp.]
MKLYRFDKKLRLFMFNEIKKIDVSLRSTLANVVAKETGNIFWMTNGSLFANPNKYNNAYPPAWIKTILQR